MLRMRIGARHGLRWGLLSLATAIALTAVISDPADARTAQARQRTTTATSSYSPAYAAIVVDANTGSVLHSANADATRHPASLTKIMTLYMLFERLESGKLSLDSQLRVSEHAADQAPTKLGLREGQHHRGRGRDQGPDHPLGQRRRRRRRREPRRLRRRIRPPDDAQGARARHDQHDLPQRLRPAGLRAGDHRARPGHARPRDPGALPALLQIFLDPHASPSAASASAITTACSARSKASTASRPATSARPASISSPR